MFGDMVYFENGWYMDTLRVSGVGTGSTQMLHGVEFEVEPQEDRGFEVEPIRSCDMGDGSHVIHTQDLIDYQFAHNREQYLVREPLRDAVTCAIISMWMVVMKEDMDTLDGIIWGLLAKVRLRSGLLRVCWMKQRNIYLGELYAVVGGSLLGNHDEEKKSKGLCIYEFVSDDYPVVYTRLDMASVDEDTWLKGLSAESGFELRLVAGIASGALMKVVLDSRFSHSLELMCIGEG
ncbi:hypothetical protein Tco_1246412 [Tanacetum coccineum]